MTYFVAWVALSFSAGILLGDLLTIGLPVLLPALLLAISGVLIFYRVRAVFISTFFLSVILLGAFSINNARILPADHISKVISYLGKEPYIVKGSIGSSPKEVNGKTSFILHASGVKIGDLIHSCRGKVLVYIKGDTNLEYGDEVALKGKLSRPGARTRVKNLRYARYLNNQGVYLLLRAENNNAAMKLSLGKNWLLRLIFRLNKKLEGIIIKSQSRVACGIVDAMLLGEKGYISPLIYDAMVKCGTVHILVVSGFNVGIIVFISMLALKVTGIAKRTRIFITIFLVIAYCLLTGSSTPVLRATVMAVVFLFAQLIRREPDIYNALGSAALFILTLDPRQIFDIGFQLSFASVLAIVYFFGHIKRRMHPELIRPRLMRWIAEAGMVSFSAWLGTFGLVAYYFRIFSPVTVLANIIIVPLATLITLGGLSVILTAGLLPALSRCFALTNEFLVALLLLASSLLVKIPFAYLNF